MADHHFHRVRSFGGSTFAKDSLSGRLYSQPDDSIYAKVF